MTPVSKAALIGAALALGACSPEIDRVFEVDTVRVLAVQKTVDRGGPEPVGVGYARPGEKVNFHMLWDRGARNQAADIPVQRMWIKGCINPRGDTFVGCADLFLQAAQDPERFLTENVIRLDAAKRPSAADTVEVEMPGVEQLRQTDDEEPPYALYILFFAACAGELGITGEDVSIRDGRLPITCTRDGERLGSDDFVIGYSSVYVFGAEYENTNPLVQNMYFDRDNAEIGPDLSTGTRIAGTACAGVGCLEVPDPTEADIPALCSALLCVPACADDGDIDKCPAHWVAPAINAGLPQNQEPDTVSARTDKFEQLTVHYHADRGGMRSDVRVLRDGTGRWNGNFAANYYAPKEPGFARIWVIVRDNRGGVDWVSTPIWVR